MFFYNWEKRFIHNKYGWVTMTLSNPNLKWNNGKIPSLFLFLSFQCSWQFLKFVFVFSKQLTVYKTRWWLNLNQGCLVSEWISHQRTLTIAERITVWLVNSLTRLDLTYKENVLFFVCIEVAESKFLNLETSHTVIPHRPEPQPLPKVYHIYS